MTTKNEEIALVHNAVVHPSGFVLSVLGDMLRIYSQHYDNSVEWHVVWEVILDGQVVDSFKSFHDALEAATFFVEKMHIMQEEYHE